MDENKFHVTCPTGRRTKNRRSEQSKWRQSKEWKALVETHARVPEAFCVHCHKKHGDTRQNGKKVVLTINHLSRRLYASKELYCTWNQFLMEIACTICNWKFESGEKPCPVCHDHYIKWNEDMCQICYDKAHPVEAEARKLAKEIRDIQKKKLLKDLRQKAKEKANATAKKLLQNMRSGTSDSRHEKKIL